MLKSEIYKLFVKQYAVYLALAALICEFIFFTIIYKERTFPNETDKREYYRIMQIMEGKLSEEKSLYITNELRTVKKSQTEIENIQNRLKRNEYKNHNDYAEELAAEKQKLKREYAVREVYSNYKYCSADPERRYMLSYDFKGMCRDYPDICSVIFIVTVTSFYFLNEETSKMLLIIKSSGGKTGNTFSAKFKALIILIGLYHLTVSGIEYLFLKSNAGNSLNFPVQSIEYFSNCRYELTIFETFAAIQTLKLSGYIFIALFTALMSMAVKKSVISAGIPLSMCLILQFAFKEAKYAYYLPFGLLRATGYFRGDSYETITVLGQQVRVKAFSEVSPGIFCTVLFVTVLFVGFVFIYGQIHFRSCSCKRNFRKCTSL